MKQKRFFLSENEIPTQWYNIQADMPNKPMPLKNPATSLSTEETTLVTSLPTGVEDVQKDRIYTI